MRLMCVNPLPSPPVFLSILSDRASSFPQILLFFAACVFCLLLCARIAFEVVEVQVLAPIYILCSFVLRSSTVRGRIARSSKALDVKDGIPSSSTLCNFKQGVHSMAS
jgi:hypothetical protein